MDNNELFLTDILTDNCINRCIKRRVNRCIGYNKNNKKCRAITKDNALFCSPCHEPLNRELIENGCFMCMEHIKLSNDIIYFKCKHAFHKDCYFEWLNVSTYENPICMLCRGEINFLKKNKDIKKKKYKIISPNLMSNINNINTILKLPL